LRRWLRSQLGRSWNEVYSEACAVIKPDSVVRNHIKFHLLEFVQRQTFLRDGCVWCFRTGWRGNELPVVEAASPWAPFYVHPETGVLCEVRCSRERWRDDAAERRDRTQRRITQDNLLRQVGGLWYECAIELFPAHFAHRDERKRFDMAERTLIDPEIALKIYGEAVFCAAKRQISRRELRKFGLVNSPLPI
jgi:hypothetical protein